MKTLIDEKSVVADHTCAYNNYRCRPCYVDNGIIDDACSVITIKVSNRHPKTQKEADDAAAEHQRIFVSLFPVLLHSVVIHYLKIIRERSILTSDGYDMLSFMYNGHIRSGKSDAPHIGEDNFWHLFHNAKTNFITESPVIPEIDQTKDNLSKMTLSSVEASTTTSSDNNSIVSHPTDESNSINDTSLARCIQESKSSKDIITSDCMDESSSCNSSVSRHVDVTSTNSI